MNRVSRKIRDWVRNWLDYDDDEGISYGEPCKPDPNADHTRTWTNRTLSAPYPTITVTEYDIERPLSKWFTDQYFTGYHSNVYAPAVRNKMHYKLPLHGLINYLEYVKHFESAIGAEYWDDLWDYELINIQMEKYKNCHENEKQKFKNEISKRKSKIENL
jgi:hypothetical protein